MAKVKLPTYFSCVFDKSGMCEFRRKACKGKDKCENSSCGYCKNLLNTDNCFGCRNLEYRQSLDTSWVQRIVNARGVERYS